MNSMINDRVTDLLELYSVPRLKPEEMVDLFRAHLDKHKRLGFYEDNEGIETTAQRIYYHIMSSDDENLIKEKRFYQKLLDSDLNAILTRGLARAKKVLPNQEYYDPVITLLLNGPGTDAVAYAEREFGINLTNLYLEYMHLPEEEALKRAYSRIESMVAHEANHIYLRQVNPDYSNVHWLYGRMFNEGLATMAETEHMPWHEKYIQRVDEWSDIIHKAVKAASLDERLQIIERMSEDPTLQQYQPDTVDRLKKVLSDTASLTPEVFDALVKESLVDRNGPLYHVGYHMWKKIEEKGGEEHIKEVVKKGPKAFLENI